MLCKKIAVLIGKHLEFRSSSSYTELFFAKSLQNLWFLARTTIKKIKTVSLPLKSGELKASTGKKNNSYSFNIEFLTDAKVTPNYAWKPRAHQKKKNVKSTMLAVKSQVCSFLNCQTQERLLNALFSKFRKQFMNIK